MKSDANGRGLILLAAGGTGGHLFPAQALAEVLISRGYTVDLATDERGDRFRGTFPARQIHIVPSATIRGRSPVAYLRTAGTIAKGVAGAYRLIGRIGPKAVAGFGGYPTLPPVLAASLRGVKTLIHDQNAVIGRANRLLAHRVDIVATSFPEVEMLGARNAHKVVETGAPVRAGVLAAQTPYQPPKPRGKFRLLVFGGSQGARVFSEVVPQAIARLPEKVRKRLSLVQQCREEDLDPVRAAYESAGIAAELAPFFSDLPQRIAAAHLVVSRSGASTVAELAIIGRPAILVPLPHAVDNDQLLNATALSKAGGAWVLPQSSFTPDRLAQELEARFAAPEQLAAAAEAARAIGNPRAAETLADVVAALAEGWPVPGTQTGESTR